MLIFSWKGQRSRRHDVKTSKIWRHVYLRAETPMDQARYAPTANYRPTPLLGLIYCRRLKRSAARQLDGRPRVMSAVAVDMLSCSDYSTVFLYCVCRWWRTTWRSVHGGLTASEFGLLIVVFIDSFHCIACNYS